MASYDFGVVVRNVSAPVNALAAALIVVISVFLVLVLVEEWFGHLNLIVLFVVRIAFRLLFFVVLGEQH